MNNLSSVSGSNRREPIDQPPAVVVIMPAFNEGRVVGEAVRNALTCFDTVVVVDDGSTDDTASQARVAGAVVVSHPVNLGQGAALETGFEWARRRKVDWVVTLDSDGQHDPRDAVELLALGRNTGADVVLGSRFLGSTEGMPATRRWLLKSALAFQNLTSGIRLTDVHNGLRLLSRKALLTLHIRQDSMAHASEIVNQLGASTLRVIEGSVTVRYTEYSLGKGQRSIGALHILFDLLLARLGR